MGKPGWRSWCQFCCWGMSFLEAKWEGVGCGRKKNKNEEREREERWLGICECPPPTNHHSNSSSFEIKCNLDRRKKRLHWTVVCKPPLLLHSCRESALWEMEPTNTLKKCGGVTACWSSKLLELSILHCPCPAVETDTSAALLWDSQLKKIHHLVHRSLWSWTSMMLKYCNIIF